MKRTITAALATVATAALLPLGATSAHAVGKASIHNCWSFQQTSDRHRISAVCNPRGKTYYIQAQCSWYSAGKGGSIWKSSPWTSDGSRATVNCGSAYVTGIGQTVYYR